MSHDVEARTQALMPYRLPGRASESAWCVLLGMAQELAKSGDPELLVRMERSMILAGHGQVVQSQREVSA